MRAGRPPADQDKERPAGAIVRVTFEFRLIQFFEIGEKFFLKVVRIIPVRVKDCPRRGCSWARYEWKTFIYCQDMS